MTQACWWVASFLWSLQLSNVCQNEWTREANSITQFARNNIFKIGSVRSWNIIKFENIMGKQKILEITQRTQFMLLSLLKFSTSPATSRLKTRENFKLQKKIERKQISLTFCFGTNELSDHGWVIQRNKWGFRWWLYNKKPWEALVLPRTPAFCYIHTPSGQLTESWTDIVFFIALKTMERSRNLHTTMNFNLYFSHLFFIHHVEIF